MDGSGGLGERDRDLVYGHLDQHSGLWGYMERFSLRHLATERQTEGDYRGLAYGHLHGDTRRRRNDRHTHMTSMIYYDSIRYPATTGAPAWFTTQYIYILQPKARIRHLH